MTKTRECHMANYGGDCRLQQGQGLDFSLHFRAGSGVRGGSGEKMRTRCSEEVIALRYRAASAGS